MHQFSDSLIAPAFLRLHSSYFLGDLIWQTIRVERIQKAIHSDSPFHRFKKKTSQNSPHSTEFLSLQTQGLKTKQHRKRKDNFSSYFFTFRNREYNFVFPFNPIPIIIWDFIFFSSRLWFQRSFRLKEISCFSFFINLSLRILWREKKTPCTNNGAKNQHNWLNVEKLKIFNFSTCKNSRWKPCLK